MLQLQEKGIISVQALRHGLAADPQNLSGINTKILMGKYITKTHYPFPILAWVTCK